MRLVQVTIPAGKQSTVLSTLEDHDIDYVLTDETSNRNITGVVYFPLPTEAVEDVLEALREAGLEEDSYTVVIEAQTVVSRRFDRLQEQYQEDEKSEDRIAREELTSEVDSITPAFPTFVSLLVISAMVATAGLLLDSPAIVVGSMVIAPLIGPAMATSVGSVLADNDLFLQGVKYQVFGFAIAIVAATAFALLARYAYLVPPGVDILSIDQIHGRLSPDFLILVVALGAGVAGAFSLSTGISSALVGVMIAAALIPPVAVIGIGIAWQMPRAVLDSSVLVLVNVLSINLAALAVLWYQGYRPEDWFRLDEARASTLKRIAALILAIVVLSAFLGATTYSSYRTSTFENESHQAIEGVLTEPQYEDLQLIDTDVTYSQTQPFRVPNKVTVTVGVSREADRPDELPQQFAEAIEDETGRQIAVEVQFWTIETA